MNENQTPEAFLEEMRQVFANREEEFRKREAAWQEKNTELQELLRKLGRQKQEQDVRETEQRERQRELEAGQERLKEQGEALEQWKEELGQRLRTQQEAEKEVLLKHNLELEKVRNEQMKLQRLTEEYEYRLSLLDSGLPEEGKPSDAPDPERWVSRTELEEREASYGKTLAGYEEELLALREERTRLIRRILEGEGDAGSPGRPSEVREEVREPPAEPVQTAPIPGSWTEEPTCGGMDFGETGGAPAASAGDIPGEEDCPGGYSGEELTAEVLCTYLKKVEPEFLRPSVHHSDEGEQVHTEYRGLTCCFLFGRPASFDVAAVRKDSPQLRKLLQQMNDTHPGIQFRYENGAIYATGYFTSDFAAAELIRRVKDIAACFKQREGER